MLGDIDIEEVVIFCNNLGDQTPNNEKVMAFARSTKGNRPRAAMKWHRKAGKGCQESGEVFAQQAPGKVGGQAREKELLDDSALEGAKETAEKGYGKKNLGVIG